MADFVRRWGGGPHNSAKSFSPKILSAKGVEEGTPTVSKKSAKSRYFWSKNTILSPVNLVLDLFGPFQALFGPNFTLQNEEKTPFLARVG